MPRYLTTTVGDQGSQARAHQRDRSAGIAGFDRLRMVRHAAIGALRARPRPLGADLLGPIRRVPAPARLSPRGGAAGLWLVPARAVGRNGRERPSRRPSGHSPTRGRWPALRPDRRTRLVGRRSRRAGGIGAAQPCRGGKFRPRKAQSGPGALLPGIENRLFYCRLGSGLKTCMTTSKRKAA